MKRPSSIGGLTVFFFLGASLAHAVVDHYVVSAPLNIMKGDSGISFSIDPQDATNTTDPSPHRVLFVLPLGVTVEGASGTGDASTGWLVGGVTNFTLRTGAVVPLGNFDLRVRDKFDGSVFGLKTITVEPTIVSYELSPPFAPFTGRAGEGFILTLRALGPSGVTITSYKDNVRLTSSVGDLSITSGGAADTVFGGTFVNGVAEVIVTLFGTDPTSRQNTITAFQVDSYVGQPTPATGVTSPALTIEPNVYDHILLRFPGETVTPGTGSGKTGAPVTQIAGASINPVYVDLVDSWHNPINPADNAGIYPLTVTYNSFFVGVPADIVPAPSVLSGVNQANVSFTLRVAASHLIQADAGGELSQSIVPVVADAGFRFKVTPDPMPPKSSAVTPFLMTVEAVDIFGNPLPSYNGTVAVSADDCSGTPLGNNTIDTAPGGSSPGAQNTITMTAGRWANRPIQIFKASNFTRLNFTDAGAGLSGTSTCFDNDPGGPAQLLFTLPGQIYTVGAYPGNINLPSDKVAGTTISATVRVTDLSWNQVSIDSPQELTIYMDNTVGYIDSLPVLTMPPVGDVVVNNIRLRTSSFRPLATAVPQVLQAQIPDPNIHGASDPIVVTPGAYAKMVLAAPTEVLSPGNPATSDGKINSISTQSYNVAFPIRVYLTDSLFNPIQTGPYSGAWPSVQLSLQGGGDFTFPTPNPAPMATSLYSASVTSRKMDTNTIVATDTLNAARFAQVSLTVQSGAVSKFVVSPDPNPLSLTADPIPTQTAGASFVLAFKAYDQFNNLAKNFSGTVNLELWEDDAVKVGYSGAISPNTISFVADPILGGVSTAAITITYAGKSMGLGEDNLQIRAFLTSPTREGKSAKFNVKELPDWSDIVLTRLGETLLPGLGAPYKTGSPTPVLAGNNFRVWVTAVDSYGNKVNEAGTANLSILTPNVLGEFGTGEVLFSEGEGSRNIQIFTAGDSVILATVTAAGFSDRSTGTITTGVYATDTSAKLVLLAPGEVLIPGSTSAPGKDSSAMTPVEANTAVPFTLLACDRYYNRTGYSGSHFSLASDDGAINRSDISVIGGSATVASVYLNGVPPFSTPVRVTATDQSDTGKTSYSDIDVTRGATYELIVPTATTVGHPFSMTVNLLDPDTGLPMVGANFPFTMEALTSSGTAATGAMGVLTGILTDGTVTLTEQSYSYVEIIKIRVTDRFNRVSDSANISVVPNGLKYIVTLPGPKTTDDLFTVTVGLYDTELDLLPIRGSVYQHPVNIYVTKDGVPAIGSWPVSVATLNDGVATFSFSYTEAGFITVNATGSVAGFPSIFNSADMQINPGNYVKVQIVAPGEVRVPGVPSLTGKSSSLPSAQAAKHDFNITVNAVDRYWNIVTTLNTGSSPSVRLSASDGSISMPIQGFSNGQVQFSGVQLNTPPEVSVTAEDISSTSLFPQSVVIPVIGRAYVAAASTLDPFYYSGPPRTFNVLLSLYEFDGVSTGSAVVGFHGKVYIEPLTPSLQPLPVENLVVVLPDPDDAEPNMVRMDGDSDLPLRLGYRVAEDVVFKFTDEDGWTGLSPTIHFVPREVDYVATTPVESRVGPPDAFTMTITPRDADTGTTAKNWSSTITVSAVSPAAVPITGTLQMRSVFLSGGAKTFQQAFSQAGVFYFTLSDGVKTSTSAAMNFLPGPLALMTTDIPATIEAGSTQTVHVTLMDAFDNPIPNLTLAFALSDASFGTLATLTGVSNVLGQSATVFNTNGQKSGLGSFTGTSGSVSVRQAFRLLGPPSTSLRVDGFGVEEGKGYTLKPEDPIFMDIAVESGTVLVSVSYSVNGGLLQTSAGPFDLLPSGLYTFELPIGTLTGGEYVKDVGRYTVEYFGTTVSGLTHSETVKTSKTFFVSAETTAEEGLVNYPNPFRAGQDLSYLEYVLSSEAGVRLTIYDMMGQRVYERSYSQGEVGGSEGLNRISWDGKNDDGEVVGNGGYVAVLEVSGGPKMKRKIAVKK